jgi:hypothetical protein
MATMSLTKSARLQERIRTAIRETPIRGHLALGIFVPEPEAEVEREAARLRRNLDLIERLLSILAELRTAVGKANAERGVAQLLAEKSAIEEELSLISKLLPAEEMGGSDDGLETWRRAPRRTSFRRRAGEVEDEIRAMRARYEQAEGGETTAWVPLLDEADTERLRARVVTCRRRLESVGDRLRELNGGVVVEIKDETLAYLRENEVI